MGAFEDFMVLEMSRRSALLTYEITGWDGDPNDGGAPAIFAAATVGTYFLEKTASVYWRKYTSTEWFAGDAALITQDVVHLYVRAADGDDSNSGFDSDNPLATLLEAESRIQWIVNHHVIIHVGAHTGNGYLIPTFRQRILNSNIYVIGDGAGVGDGFTELKASTVAGAGSSNLVVITTGMSVDEFRGRTIEILSGAAQGDRRTIRNNSTTEIFPIEAFSSAVSSGDTFRVVNASIQLDETSGFPSQHYKTLSIGNGAMPTDEGSPPLIESPRLYFINLKFHVNALKLMNSAACFFGVELINNSQLNLASSHVLCGYDHTEYEGSLPLTLGPYNDLGVSSNTSWTGWGPTFSGLVFFGDRLSLLVGNIVVLGYAYISYATLIMNRGSISNGLVVQDQGKATIYSYSNPQILIDVTSGPCVLVREHSYFVAGGLVLTGPGDGMYVRDGGRAYIDTMSGTLGGIGHKTAHGGVIRWAWTAELSGTQGDFSENDGETIRSNAELVNGASFVDISTLSKIYRNNFP